jgi:hypothetical protein
VTNGTWTKKLIIKVIRIIERAAINPSNNPFFWAVFPEISPRIKKRKIPAIKVTVLKEVI